MKRIIFVTILGLVFSVSAFAQNALSNCAKIEVSGGGVIQPGEPMIFTANVTGLTKNSTLEYEWKVSSGTISSGQGTPSIAVDTIGLSDINITAEVKIKGLHFYCTNTVSSSGVVRKKIPIIDPDEFGRLPDNEIKARIQNLYVELDNNLTAQGCIINYGTDKEIANRERQIQKAIKSLKLDVNRLTMVRGGANPNGAGVWTKVWIVPPGADNPQP